MNRPSIVQELLAKYDRPGPRYTSYPTAVEFHEGFSADDYVERLGRADVDADAPLSLYVHLPFCSERCAFCGCNVVIAREHAIAVRYLGYLHREIDLLASYLPHRRRLTQYHWGGGTPTYQTIDEMRALHHKVLEHFTLDDDAEVAIEVDPRVTTPDQLVTLRELGFNRISLGVQDFDAGVQDAIGRHQTREQTHRLHERCRELQFASVNFDLIYGLPRQTAESFARNLEAVIDLRPDRIALYSYAHLPKMRPNQKAIEPKYLPTPEVKLHLFGAALERFVDAGYVQIGMDHFALPDDEMTVAMRRRQLHRNFMGYTVKSGTEALGLGISAIGDIRGCFAQNTRKLNRYYAALDEGRFPVERGYVLDEDDTIRRAVILAMMCNFHLDFREIETRFGVEFRRYFATELDELAAEDGPVAHGFVELHPDRIEIVGHGRIFVRNVCMVFDRHLRRRPGAALFSRTV